MLTISKEFLTSLEASISFFLPFTETKIKGSEIVINIVMIARTVLANSKTVKCIFNPLMNPGSLPKLF